MYIHNRHEILVDIYHYEMHTIGLYYKIDMKACEFTLKDFIYNHDRTPRAVRKGCLHCRNNSDENTLGLKFEIMGQVSSGVSFIHEHNEVHRDLKPSNSVFLISRYN